jgi:integrase/recombinase XerD
VLATRPPAVDVRRVDIECFARDLEDRGKARATVARRLCTVVGFYRYAEEEGVIDHSPAVHIRRPRIDYESHVAHLDRNELGVILVTAGLSSPRDHALVSLLALNGLRVSEAIGANIEALGQERGHRTLTVLRKGGKLVTPPLAPRVARAIDLAVGERIEGPIFIDNHGQRLDRHLAGRIVRHIARPAEIGKRVGPHTLRHAFITAALDAKRQRAVPPLYHARVVGRCDWQFNVRFYTSATAEHAERRGHGHDGSSKLSARPPGRVWRSEEAATTTLPIATSSRVG